MATKLIKIYHYTVDKDIWSLLSSLQTQSTAPEMSHVSHGAVFQFRDVREEGNVILAQFRKVITDGKPTIGEAYNHTEKDLEEDVMHHCHLLYNKTTKTMLIQNNPSVSTTPNSSISRLISKIFPTELPEGLGIKVFIREDALKEVKENRGEVQGMEFAIDKDTEQYMNSLTGGLNDMSSEQLGGLHTKTINVKSKISPGSLTIELIENLARKFLSGSFFKLKFNLPKRKSIDINDFKKYSDIEVELTDNKHLDTESFYHELKKINEAENN